MDPTVSLASVLPVATSSTGLPIHQALPPDLQFQIQRRMEAQPIQLHQNNQPQQQEQQQIVKYEVRMTTINIQG